MLPPVPITSELTVVSLATALAAVKRTLSFAVAAATVPTYSLVASGRTPVAPYVTTESPLPVAVDRAGGVWDNADARVPAAPPPPTRAGAAVRKMLATPLPGVAPSDVPRYTAVPRFCCDTLAIVSSRFRAAFGVTPMIAMPPVFVMLPMDSLVAR